MTNDDRIQWTCEVQACGYLNAWTLQEVRQLGVLQIHLASDEYDVFSLPCRNPRMPIGHAYHSVRVPKEPRS